MPFQKYPNKGLYKESFKKLEALLNNKHIVLLEDKANNTLLKSTMLEFVKGMPKEFLLSMDDMDNKREYYQRTAPAILQSSYTISFSGDNHMTIKKHKDYNDSKNTQRTIAKNQYLDIIIGNATLYEFNLTNHESGQYDINKGPQKEHFDESITSKIRISKIGEKRKDTADTTFELRTNNLPRSYENTDWQSSPAITREYDKQSQARRNSIEIHDEKSFVDVSPKLSKISEEFIKPDFYPVK